jgi:hypothetical protein
MRLEKSVQLIQDCARTDVDRAIVEVEIADLAIVS